MITYNASELSKPMTYERFKKLPEDIQQLYLDGLREQYRVSDSAICAMMGVKQNTFSYHCRIRGFSKKEISKMSAKETREYKDRWDAFVAGEDSDEGAEADCPPITDGEATPEDTETQPVVESSDGETVARTERPASMQMDNLTITFSGLIDPDGIANTLRMMLGKESRGNLKVVFRAEGDDEFLPF